MGQSFKTPLGPNALRDTPYKNDELWSMESQTKLPCLDFISKAKLHFDIFKAQLPLMTSLRYQRCRVVLKYHYFDGLKTRRLDDFVRNGRPANKE